MSKQSLRRHTKKISTEIKQNPKNLNLKSLESKRNFKLSLNVPISLKPF